VIAYGSQYITTKVQLIARHAQTIQKVFGVLVLLLAIAMFFQYDLLIQTKLLKFYPLLLPTL